MAQPKVKDFFQARKKRDIHPAKRRKIEVQPSSSFSYQSDLAGSEVKRAQSPSINENANLCPSNPEVVVRSGRLASCLDTNASNTSQTRACRGLRSKTSSSTRLQKATCSSGFDFKSQKKITDLLEFKFPTESDASKSCSTDFTPTPSNADKSKADRVTVSESNISEIPEENMIAEEITSVKDDHCSSSTPRKRSIQTEANTESSKTRKCKVPHRRVVECPSSPSNSAKKKLELNLDLDSSERKEFLPECAESNLLDFSVPEVNSKFLLLHPLSPECCFLSFRSTLAVIVLISESSPDYETL